MNTQPMASEPDKIAERMKVSETVFTVNLPLDLSAKKLKTLDPSPKSANGISEGSDVRRTYFV